LSTAEGLDALVIVDMQEGLLLGDEKHELTSVVERINRLAARVRKRGGAVFFVQHQGTPGDGFAPGEPGWPILAAMDRKSEDRVVPKTLNNAFCGTSLGEDLSKLSPARVVVGGWATDFCVDATVRAAAESGHAVVVVSDGHTVCDRPHLRATQIIEHHHAIWRNLLAPGGITLAIESEI